jgi:hypothetical protein
LNSTDSSPCAHLHWFDVHPTEFYKILSDSSLCASSTQFLL